MGTEANLKSISPHPPPPQNKQSPQFFSKEKGNKKLCFLRVNMDQGLKEVKKVY